MSNKLPQFTDTIWKRLTRVAKDLDAVAAAAREAGDEPKSVRYHARANTCLQAAGRLRAYFHEYGEHRDATDA